MANEQNKKHNLLYIMNPQCGWCKKADPVVAELLSDGYDITILDITKPEQAKIANEAKSKHNVQCGTPLFLDAETGNSACGFKEKNALEPWAKGEKTEERTLPTPPTPPQRPTPKKYKLEYIWPDSEGNLRSKIRYSTIVQMPNEIITIDKISNWSFDGSSTNQADTNNSDLIIRPVRLFPNPMESRQTPSWYVLCEVLNSDETQHKSNLRKHLLDEMKKSNKKHDMWIGVEQEYVILDEISDKPYGWADYENSIPPPQGEYYCGVGGGKQKGRIIAEQHANMCIQSGLIFEGFHPEVMLSQWEYQIGPGNPVDIADQLLFSRFLLQRVTERVSLPVAISFDAKVEDGDWNGSGAHINFSTMQMRANPTLEYLNVICSALAESHNDAIIAYGKDNEKRLTGNHETSTIDTFTWGENDRTASVRIPFSAIDGMGYLEDRRPAANINPYEAFSYLVSAMSKVSTELLVNT